MESDATGDTTPLGFHTCATPKGLCNKAKGWPSGLPWLRVGRQAYPGPPTPTGLCPERRRSIPNMPLVPYDPMLGEERPKLVLKRDFAVMLFLMGNVLLHGIQYRWAYGKHTKPTLPRKTRHPVITLFDPLAGHPLQFLHPVRLSDATTKSGKDMHVIGHPANNHRRTIEFFGYASQKGVELIAQLFV